MRLIPLAAFCAAFLLPAEPSQAAPPCNPRAQVLELLAQKYKETPIAVGVTNTGGLIEVLSSSKGGTWTIIVTTPEGMSCLVSAGEGWRTMEHQLPAPVT